MQYADQNLVKEFPELSQVCLQEAERLWMSFMGRVQCEDPRVAAKISGALKDL